MSIRDIMNTNVETIDPNTSIREAAQRMARNDYGALPVVENGDIVGMITDRDITIRAVADGNDPDSTDVRSVMSDDVFTCKEDEDVEQLAQLMQDRKIRRVPVVDSDNNVVGLVSMGDLAVLSRDDQRVADTIEEVSQPLQH